MCQCVCIYRKGTFCENFNDIRLFVGWSFFRRSSVGQGTAHMTSWYNCITLTRCECFHRKLHTKISQADMVYSN